MSVGRYDKRMRQSAMPGISAGPQVGAEAFGGGQARDVMRLGGSLHGLGMEALRQSQVKQTILDEANQRDQITQLHAKFSRESQAIYQKRGKDAANAEQEVSELIDRLDQEARQSFTNQEQMRRWENTISAFKSNEVNQAISYSAQQTWAYDQETYAAQSGQAVTDATAAEAKFADDPTARDEAQYLSEEIIVANVRKRMQGSSEEAIALEEERELSVLYTSIAQERAAISPQAALEYLDLEHVKKVIPATMRKRMREQWETVVDLDIDIAWARNLAQTDLPLGEVMALAHKEHPNDPQRAKLVVDMYGQFAADRANAQKLEVVQAKDELWAQFAAVNYDVTKIPESVRINHPEEYMRMLDYSKKIAGFTEKGGIPNFRELDKLSSMAPTQLRTWLSEEDNYERMMLWAGSESAEATRLMEQSRMSDTEWAAKQAKSTGGAAGAGGGSGTGFDFKRAFERNFVAFAQNQGWWSNTEFDPKNTDHTRFENNAWDEWRRRMGDVEKHPGKSALSRPDDVLFSIIRDVNAGKLDLNKPTYDAAMEAELAGAELGAAVPVAVESLPIAQKQWNQGEKAIAIRDPDTGGVITYGDIDVKDLRDVHQNIVDYRPDRLLRAYTPGIINGLALDAGDYATISKGFTNVFDQYGNWKSGRRAPTLAKLAPSEAEAVMPEPAKSKEMARLEKEKGATFEWRNGFWFGVFPEEGVSRLYDSNSRVIRHSVQPYFATEGASVIAGQLEYEKGRLADMEMRLPDDDTRNIYKSSISKKLKKDIEEQRQVIADLQTEFDKLVGEDKK